MGPVSDASGWTEWDGSRQGADVLATTPFTRLARAHALSVGGDALFALGLAGTIFFLSPAEAARVDVALYLLLTIAPFAVLAPLIGPALDRMKGGRRWTIFASAVGRALICVLLARHLDSLWFYPEAFGMLVFGKAYQISKSAIVPTTVRGDGELVEANSKLSLISGLAVVVALVPGGLLTWLGGPVWVLGFGGVVFAAMAIVALQVPRTIVAPEPADADERAELHTRAILLAASGMGLLRGVVGFLAFLLAFAYKSDSPWRLGVVAGAAQIGFMTGSFLSPKLRKFVLEERILIGSLVTVGVVGLGAALTGGLMSAALLSLVVGAASSAAKQAFDAIVQRDAPDANRGRSFAKFETRFQIVWVVGALIPVAIDMPLQFGFLIMAVAALLSATSYLLGIRGLSLDASARVRAWRRRLRGGADDEAAQRYGLDQTVSFETEPPPLAAAEPGVSDARPAPPPTAEPSAAAQAAERRRAADEAHQARVDEQVADAGDALADAVEAVDSDQGQLDLDWHPRG
jgi:hypothetical protein